MASASSEAGSTRSQEIEELERFIDSYVLEYQVQGLLGDKADGDLDLDNGGKVPQVRVLLFHWMTCRNIFFLSTDSGGFSGFCHSNILLWGTACIKTAAPNGIYIIFYTKINPLYLIRHLLPPISLLQWTDDCNNKKDGSWTSSRGRGSTKPVSVFAGFCLFHSIGGDH